MKKNAIISLLFLLLAVIVPGKVNAQQETFSLSFKDIPLQEVFQQIEQSSHYRFIFNNDDVLPYRITGNFQNQKLTSLLDGILKDKPFLYSIQSNTVIISYTPRNSPIVQEGIRIRGTVKDQEGNLLPGVTIRIQNSTLGVTTDIDGQYSITVPDKETTLVFSFVGMKTRTLQAGNRQTLDIVLENDTQEIAEVIVTGIFQKSQESYTGAVTTITEKELKAFGNRNILTTIRNIDPAFNIMQDNINGSDPNKLPEIQIRGNSGLPDVKDIKTDARANRNTPLFIQDGFEITLQKMMDLNEHDVASITILKDASATSLYGSRGANGVVVITTKQPEAGKLRISYQGDFNIEIPDLSDYRLLNARDKLEAEKSANLYTSDRSGSIAQQTLDEIYNEKKAEVERGVDTYWLSQPLHTGYGQRHTLRLEGGDPTFRYSASASYNDIVGVMKESGRKNFMGNITLTYNYKNVIFRNDLNIGLNKATNSPYGSFSDYVKLNPYDAPYDENGVLKYYLENYTSYLYTNVVTNPLYNATLNTFNTSEYTDLNNNFSIEWKILPELRFQGRFGITKQLNNSDIYKPAKHTDFSEYKDDDYLRKGSYEYGSGKSLVYEGNITLDYSKTFAEKHQIFAGVNFSTYQNKAYRYDFKVEGFTNENLDFLALALQYAKDEKPNGSESLVRKLGYTANFNYTYDQRYFIDGSFRLDGSSQFGNNKRFAPFWSVGTGWNIHREHFFKCDFFNQLRIRASYGITGSQNFNAYQALRTYKYSTDDRYQQWIGAQLMAMGNEDLKWQQTKEFNLGFDTGFWNNRVNFSFNYYRNTTSNLLSEYELPLSNGFSSYTANIGKVENTGFELSAHVYVVRNTEKNIFWSVGGSILRNKNKIIKISDALKQANEELEAEGGANPNYMYREGESTNTIYAVRSLGIDPSTGQEIYLNREGLKTFTWDARDKVACGVPEKYRGNLITTVRYKNLSANLVFGFRFGGKLYNNTLIDKVENADLKGNVDRRVFTQRWIKAGDKVKFTQIGKLYPTNMTSRFVQKENMFECQNINVSYDLNNPWLQDRLKLEVLTISCNMGDVFRLSTVKQERGIAYPFSRKVSLSLSATF